jgi:4-methyl-5(b-hydroxyethyl)-thiazole monophosphate biosynthesis
MVRVMIPVVDGVEEMEVVIVVDTLRRAGWDALLVGMGDSKTVTASRSVRFLADVNWMDIDVDSFDILVIPGGKKGTDALVSDERVLGLVRSFVADGKFVCAICAGPVVLQAAGILHGRKATCHPAVRSGLIDAEVIDERVVRDGVIITSQGPGTAMEFALAVVRAVEGLDAAKAIAEGLVLKDDGLSSSGA